MRARPTDASSVRSRGQAEAALLVLDPLDEEPDDPFDEEAEELEESDEPPDDDEPDDELSEEEPDEDSLLPDFTVLLVEVLRESVR